MISALVATVVIEGLLVCATGVARSGYRVGREMQDWWMNGPYGTDD